MSETPAISAVIPLYNKASYISRALNSVLAQTFQDFEVIVVDDGSTDRGAAIVKEFTDSRIRLIHQENRGVSAARNRGIEASRAELVAFLDADDEWLPKHLETIAHLRIKFPNAGAYSTAYIIHEQNGQRKCPKYHAIPSSPWEGVIPSYFLSSALGNYPVNSSTLCIERGVYEDIGGYPVGVSYGEDAYFWGRIALRYPIAFSWETGAIYRRDAHGRACVKLVPLKKEPFVTFFQETPHRFDLSCEAMQYLSEYANKLELSRALRNIMADQLTEARDILSSCNTTFFRIKKCFLIIMTCVPRRLFNILWSLKRIVAQALQNRDYTEDPWFKVE